ncbi:MAG: IPT/TIG domain-containing protein [Planctomycetales bacterium]|nr:IPT/TIG domain-containing protein [Planctomycetales bacterium]
MSHSRLPVWSLLLSLTATGCGASSGAEASTGGSPRTAPPSIAWISPASGSATGGSPVTIYGSDIQAGARVTIGGAEALSTVTESHSRVTCLTPAGTPGSATVSLANPDGQAVTINSGYTYLPPLSVASVCPSLGATGGGTTATISGAGFQTGASVAFGGAAALGVSVVSSTRIQCVTPAGASGLADVGVLNPDGQSATLSGVYRYVAPPTITSATPPEGLVSGGTYVTIGGADFLSGALVSFGSSLATSVVVASSSCLSCVTPAGAAGTVDVVVINPDGLFARLTAAFTYVNPGSPAGSAPSTWSATWSAAGSLASARVGHTASLLADGGVLVAGGVTSSPAGAPLASAEVRSARTGTWTTTGSLAGARCRHTTTTLEDGSVLAVGGSSGSTDLSTAEVYHPLAGTWSATGSLACARQGHTATLLRDGRLLVVGGSSGAAATRSCELYLPSSGTWTAAATLLGPRSGHTASLLPDGRVLVVGGEDSGFLGSAEIYDPATGRWCSTGSLATGRARHTATLLTDGSVLVVGGDGGAALSGAELFRPSSGTWTSTGRLASARTRHTAALLPDGNVLIAGGAGGTGSVAIAETYDPTAGTWTFGGVLVTPRWSAPAVLLPDATVLMVGGENGSPLASVEACGLGAGSWLGAQPLRTARLGSQTVLLSDGTLLVSQGGGGTGSIGPIATAERYDSATDTWTRTGDPRSVRRGPTATMLPGGSILVAGGFSNLYALVSSEIYDPTTGSWTYTGSLATGRFCHVAANLPDRKVLVAGGYVYSGPQVTGILTASATAEIYDPVSRTWTATVPLAIARANHTATVLGDGRILVVGGIGGTSGTAEIYDPATGKWVFTGALQTPRFCHTATLLRDGSVLVTGGFGVMLASALTLASAEIYVPALGTWMPTGGMSASRVGHTATTLPSGRTLVVGGMSGSSYGGYVGLNSVEVYGPETGTWSAGPALARGRDSHTAACLPDGRVLVIGGYDRVQGAVLSGVEV